MARPDPFRKYTGLKAVYKVRADRHFKPMPENDNMCFRPGTLVILPVDLAEMNSKHLVEYVSELDGTVLELDPVKADGTTALRGGAVTKKKKASKKKVSKKATKKTVTKKATKKKASRRPEVDANTNRRKAARKKATKKVASKKATKKPSRRR